jgi:hypothetical protein
MPTLKKLIFAPFFLIVFALLFWQLSFHLNSYDLILAVSFNNFLSLVIIAVLVLLSSLFFVLFASFTNNWKLIIPVAILASIIPMFFLPQNKGLITSVGVLASFLIIHVSLEGSLKTYINFEPASIFGPSIRHLSTLLIIVFSFIYFLSISQKVAGEGFQIPDSLIDEALKFVPQQEQQVSQNSQNTPTTIPSSITPEQLELLKQNPQLLKQYGLDPSILDEVAIPKNTSNIQPQQLLNETIKQGVKDQLQQVVKPFINFIAPVLGLLLFFVLVSVASFLNILLFPILWIFFRIFEATGFIKFTTETRSVKKMVI